MQISDLFGQYDVNTAANPQGTGNTAGSTGVNASQSLADAMRMLPAGSVFEATVNEMENGEVLLGLSDGRNVSARLSAGVSLNIGEAMFFQVKSNNGMQIEIRPFQTGPEGNPTLLKALDAAGLKVNDKNLTLVNSMMQEQMPIDKNSLLAMVRLSGNHPEVAPATLVEMTKVGLPVTAENAAAFENYKTDQNAMMKELNMLFETLPEMAGNGKTSASDAVTFHKQLTAILGGTDADAGGNVTVKEQAQRAEISDAADMMAENKMTVPDGKTAVQNMTEMVQQESRVPAQSAGQMAEQNEAVTQQTQELGIRQAVQSGGTVITQSASMAKGGILAAPATLGVVLDSARMQELRSVYAELSGKDMELSELTPKQFLSLVSSLLTEDGAGAEQAVHKLFRGKAYQQVLRSALEEEWLLKPQDIRDSGRMNEFYARVSRQMGQLSQIVAETGGNTQTAQAASDLQNNISFMNVLNQTYTYMQIPLKMTNQNAKGDLYVYTNKKKLAEKDGELSAFLHLDMEHLGSTDVSVKMHGKNVGTKFYLADDTSYRVVEEHIPLLQQQLEKLGYQCRIDVENEEKKVDLVDDFLKKDKPAGGIVHRYSFDMRA